MIAVRALFCATLLFALCFEAANSARVLALFPTFGKSHLIIQMEVIKTIMDKGHDITIVTTQPLSNKNATYRHVKLPEAPFDSALMNAMIDSPKDIIGQIRDLSYTLTAAMSSQETAMADLWKSGIMEESFDLVVFGAFLNEHFMGVAAHFKCPIVVIDTHKPFVVTNAMIGTPTELSYVPTAMMPNSQPMRFLQRVQNFLFYAGELVFGHVLMSKLTTVYEKHFPLDKYPPFTDVLKNTSLILHTSHFSEGTIRPLPPAFIQIGGIQAKPTPDPLPEDIQKIMDASSEHGVIYFSLGTNVYSADRKPETMNQIYKVMASLKQTVIWKWESDKVPGTASNIVFRKWLPQDDILAHPNLRLFITHCGLGSVVESKYHGVPILAMPFFGDQHGNAEGMVKAGFGLQVDYHSLTEDEFKNAIVEVLNNPIYRNNIKRFSKLYRDRPMGIRETTAYWLEYVIRHRGAKHIQSPAVHMSVIAYHGWDVMAFIIGVLYLIYKILAIFICKCLCRCRSKSKKNSGKRKHD